ncbi:MAG: hypothetical protein ACOYOL_09585 [Chthoniobacterales bacterium]
MGDVGGSGYFKKVLSLGAYNAQKPASVTQRSDKASNNIVITRLDYAFCVLTLTAFGHVHEGLRTDVVLWNLRIKPGMASMPAALSVNVEERFRMVYPQDFPRDGHGLVSVSEDGQPANRSRWNDPTRPCELRDPRLAVVAVPDEIAFAGPDCSPPGGNQFASFVTPVTPRELAAGEEIEGAILVPRDHEEIGTFTLEWAKSALAAEREFWETHRAAITFRVPDPQVQDMLDSCARNILQAREIKEGATHFQVGATVYRGLWVVDGFFIVEAARYLGYEDAGALAIETLLKQAHPDGSIAVMPEHSKETGVALATFVRQCELSADWARLGELWPTILRALDFIRSVREEAAALPRDHVAHGLWPDSFPDGGMGGVRPEYTGVLWTLVGLKFAARAARSLKKDEDAATFEREYGSLWEAFKKHAAKNFKVTADGFTYLPMAIPGGSSDHSSVSDYAGEPSRWARIQPLQAAYALCQSIYPGELFDAADPLVQNTLALLDHLDDDEGIPKEAGWLGADALWTYFASFAAHTWAYAGRWDKTVDYLYAFANHASPLRVWREEQSLRGHPAERCLGDMPHNWASAEFIRMVRHLLVFERGDVLELLPGLPPEWSLPGQSVIVEQTPTRFGEVSLRVDPRADGSMEIHFSRESTGHMAPAQIRLRAPGVSGSVRINGTAVVVPPDRWIDLT